MPRSFSATAGSIARSPPGANGALYLVMRPGCYDLSVTVQTAQTIVFCTILILVGGWGFQLNLDRYDSWQGSKTGEIRAASGSFGWVTGAWYEAEFHGQRVRCSGAGWAPADRMPKLAIDPNTPTRCRELSIANTLTVGEGCFLVGWAAWVVFGVFITFRTLMGVRAAKKPRRPLTSPHGRPTTRPLTRPRPRANSRDASWPPEN